MTRRGLINCAWHTVLRKCILFLCRYFRDPQPSYRDAVSNFCSEIERSLRSGVNRACSFCVLFRTDVFEYLFGGKGRDCPHRLGFFYDLDDFAKAFFPNDWYKCYNRLGDGCKIDFPLRMYEKIQWLPLYSVQEGCNIS